MTREEFLKKIDEVSEYLTNNCQSLRYTCNSIKAAFMGEHSFSYNRSYSMCEAKNDYMDVFNSAFDEENDGFFGDSSEMENQNTRFLALCLFEQVALDEKLYERY